MNVRVKILLAFVSLSLTLCIMSNTYSRYVADTTGDFELAFAKWQILVNDTDITSNNSSNVVITPVIEENENIRSNTIAPSSKGYFDININPSNVDVSFDYNISLSFVNDEIPDLIISKYSIIDDTYEVGDTLTLNNLDDNSITGTLNFDNSTEDFSFKPFTIRVYFEWYEGENENMNDTTDTQIAINDEGENNLFEISANISFNQHIND